MYVDDIIGICLESEFEEIKSTVIKLCENLLGPNAIAMDKWACGRQLDVLGWHIDLDLMRVSIARRNFLKVVCGFFDLNILHKLTIHELERLASWSARYTTILRHAAPLTSVLYNGICGYNNRNISIVPNKLCRSAILIWRCLLCLLEFDPKAYSRPLSSFTPSNALYQICFDASLTGIGVGVKCLARKELIAITSYDFPFDLHQDPKYQNTVEFIAVVTGLWILFKNNIRNCSVELVGDSISALTWGSTERFRGILNLGSVIAFILLGTRCDLWVSSSVHIAGEDNTLYDQLSRGISARTLGYDANMIYDLGNDSEFIKLISFCNPSIDYNGEETALFNLWNHIWKLIH
jgi:hypothetical protein